MFDFTSLDAVMISKFWIYFLGSFVVGGVIGGNVVRIFFNRRKEIIEAESKVAKEKLKELDEMKAELEEKNKELKDIKLLLMDDKEYWLKSNVINRDNQVDKKLYDMLNDSK